MSVFQSVLQWVLSLLGTWGYLIVFLACVLENLFIIGSFTPGDVITAAAAFTATTPQGQQLNPWVLFGLATLGTFIGTNISYFIGRRGGRDLIARVGPRFGIGLDAIEAGEEYFERHGSPTIVFARFVAVMKNLAPALAGASRMHLFWYEVYSFVGAVAYAGLLTGIGWFLGSRFQQGLKYLGAFSWVVLAAIALVAGGAWIANQRRVRRKIAEGAAEYEEEHGPIEVAETDAAPESDDGQADDDA